MATVDVVRCSVHVSPRARDGVSGHRRSPLPRLHEQDVVEDDRLSVRQGRASLLPRQPFLQSACGEWAEDFLESRQRVGTGGAGAGAQRDAPPPFPSGVITNALFGGCPPGARTSAQETPFGLY